MSIGFHNVLYARLVVSAGIFLSFMASIASAYDYGCQYFWENPSPDNDLKECIMSIPRNNSGVLLPPIIPALFFLFVFISYPIIFLCRICGGCGSNTQRPGADCCFDGEEWDEVDEVEKSRLYPRRHVCCIKVLCLIVLVCSIVPIIITPIGFRYGKEFWDNFYYQTETEIIEWAVTEKEILQKGLSMGNGTYIPPLTQSTFDGFDDIFDKGRDKLKYINELVLTHYKTITSLAVYTVWVPLILLAFLIVFIVCNCRKMLPALFTFIYFIPIVVFCILSCCFMLLGVVSVLTCGEVELQNRQLPGVLQWYGVPWCEKNSFFPSLKVKFAEAEGEKVTEGCTRLIQLCDDQPLPQLPNIPTSQQPNIALGQLPNIPLEQLPNIALGQIANIPIPQVPDNPNGPIPQLSRHMNSPQSLNSRVELPNIANIPQLPQGMELSEYVKHLKSLDVTEYMAIIQTMKPFNCSLKPSTMSSVCTDVETLDEILNSTMLKDGFPWEIACTTPNCTIGSCAEECVDSIRPYGAELREKIDFGKRISNAIRRVFINSDCDTFITRLVRPMKQCGLLSKGSFLIGAGLGLEGLMLWFGIILLFKGQKLFFPTPK